MTHNFYFDVLTPPSSLDSAQIAAVFTCLEESGFTTRSPLAAPGQSAVRDVWVELEDRSARVSVKVRRIDENPEGDVSGFNWDPFKYDVVELTTSMRNMEVPSEAFSALWESLPDIFRSVNGIYAVGASERMIGPGLSGRRLHLKVDRLREVGNLPAIAGFIVLASTESEGAITGLREAAAIEGCTVTTEEGLASLTCSSFPLAMPDTRWSALLRWRFDLNSMNRGALSSAAPLAKVVTDVVGQSGGTTSIYSEYNLGDVERVDLGPGADQWMTSCREREEYPLLGWLDPNGYTFFRGPQHEGVLLELDAILQEQTDPFQVEAINRTRQLVETAAEHNRSVVAFVGRE